MRPLTKTHEVISNPSTYRLTNYKASKHVWVRGVVIGRLHAILFPVTRLLKYIYEMFDLLS